MSLRKPGVSSRRARAIVAATLLAGCASRPVMWVKPGADSSQFAQDSAQCDYEVSAATANYGSSTPAARTLGGAIGQGFGQGLGRAIEMRKLEALCLRARGYYPQDQQVDYGTTARAETPAVMPVAAKPFLSPEVATARIDDLRPRVTTTEGARAIFGQPMSQSAIAGGTLLQWMYQDGSKVAHIAVLFDQTGTMVRVTTQTRIGF